MNKIVDKMWESLWVNLWRKCGEKISGWWKNVIFIKKCEKVGGFTHNGSDFTLRFTQENYLCYNSLFSTISTGFITTIINNLLNRYYNINVRRCV